MSETELSLARAVSLRLRESRMTVAVAEGSTGGRIGERLVRYPGATAFFLGGVVTYDYTSRTKLLGIPQSLFVESGSVSERAVLAMAAAVRDLFGADVGVASTGVTGPSGKNVGEVWIAVTDGKATVAERHQVSPRSRIAMQTEFTRLALRALLNHVAAYA